MWLPNIAYPYCQGYNYVNYVQTCEYGLWRSLIMETSVLNAYSGKEIGHDWTKCIELELYYHS